jgi:chitosanase
MAISDSTINKILSVLKAAETGSASGDYSLVSLLHDGINDCLQVTYGIQFDEASGDLARVLTNYSQGSGQFVGQLTPYIGSCNIILPDPNATELSQDTAFQSLLQQAGADTAMQQVQDSLFESETWTPALNWAKIEGFTLALSLLVISDSFLQSGEIPTFLRDQFAAVPPIDGGDEKTWITEYTAVRNNWLLTSGDTALENSAYRTECYVGLIENNDWDLTSTINMNGVLIS